MFGELDVKEDIYIWSDSLLHSLDNRLPRGYLLSVMDS